MGRPTLQWDKMSREEIIEFFLCMYNKIKPKNYTEYKIKSNDTPNLYIIKKYLGLTWNELLLETGLKKENQLLSPKRVDKQYYFNKIKELEKKLGRKPTLKEFNENVTNSSSNLTIKKVFGSLEDFIAETGLDDNRKNRAKVKENPVELIERYRGFCNKIGKVATWEEMYESNKIYNPSIFTCRFGGINQLRKLAKVEELPIRARPKYTKYKLTQALKEEYIKKGRRLKQHELQKCCDENPKLCSITTLLRYFKTTCYSKIWDEIEQSIIKDYIKIMRNKLNIVEQEGK